jgi:hypothetical protein
MPKGAVKLSRDQVKSFLGKDDQYGNIPFDRENYYKLDGMIISFRDLNFSRDFTKPLKATEAEMLEGLRLVKENVLDYSKIITVNGIQFLVYQYENGDNLFLRFRSDYDKDNRNIVGVIQFKKPDEEKAQKALQTFLSTVHFKE